MTPTGKLIKVKNLMTRVASEEISLASAAVIEISRAGGVNSRMNKVHFSRVYTSDIDNVAKIRLEVIICSYEQNMYITSSKEQKRIF